MALGLEAGSRLAVLDKGQREERLSAYLLVDVVYLIVEVDLRHPLGEEIAHIRLHIVAVAREDILLLGGGDRCHELQARNHGVLVVVGHSQFLFHHRLGGIAALVAQGDSEVVDAVAQQETLHVDKAEIQVVERLHAGTVQVVFLVIAHRIALLHQYQHLGGGTVIAICRLCKLHRPGIKRQVGLHIRSPRRCHIEGAIAEECLQLLLRHRAGCTHDQRRDKCQNTFHKFLTFNS